jgi:precorrin isomerase
MSLVTQISALITRIGTEFKSVRTSQGVLANLTTTAKGDLVSAINEVKSATAGAAGINDSTTTTTSTWSSSKTDSSISAAVAAVVGAAPAALDTLVEIATQLQSDESGAAALTTAVGYRLRFDAAQTLTGPQQTQGQANLNVYSTAQIGDATTDFAAQFVAALS